MTPSTPRVDHGRSQLSKASLDAIAHDQQDQGGALGRGAVLEADGLSVRLRLAGGRFVLAVTDVSFAMRPGRVLALVGESGCGKSVLASSILGLLPANAQVRGEVRLSDDGRAGVASGAGHGAAGGAVELLRAPETVLARRVRGRWIGLVPQSAATHLTPVRTARSQLTETVQALDSHDHGRSMLSWRLRSPMITGNVDELATQVGLDPADLDLYPHELSGGMAQRVALALALAGNPSVILADEPTAGLDRVLVERTVDLLRALADDGRSVLLITHDLTAAERVADDVAVMYAGRLLELGPAGSVLPDPWHDYTRGLLGARSAGGMVPIPGHPPSLVDLPDGCTFHRRCPGKCSGDVALSRHGERAVACL